MCSCGRTAPSKEYFNTSSYWSSYAVGVALGLQSSSSWDGRRVRDSDRIAENLLPLALPAEGLWPSRASALAPVQPAELLGNSSGGAVGLNKYAYASASACPARLPSRNRSDGLFASERPKHRSRLPGPDEYTERSRGESDSTLHRGVLKSFSK